MNGDIVLGIALGAGYIISLWIAWAAGNGRMSDNKAGDSRARSQESPENGG